jgi:lipid A disaccharide synthetase
MNARLHSAQHRFVELAAFHEIRWAEDNGRKTAKQMLPSERAAKAFNEANFALCHFQFPYREQFSKEFAVLCQRIGNPVRREAILEANQTQRRKALLKLRRERHPLLLAYIAARAAYIAARPAVFNEAIAISGRA